MSSAVKFIVALSLWAAIQCSPYDDGKYRPQKYNVYDDGKYYRPLDEGKYVPGDEGKYTYVYLQGLYPEDDGDYRYVHQDVKYTHQVGPEGGFGGNGGFGGKGGNGGNGDGGGTGPNGPGGPGGPNGPNGPGGPRGPGGPPGPGGPSPPRKPNKIDYIGNRIYASRYPYIHNVIKALVDEYVSEDSINFGDESQGSTNHYRRVYADKEIAVKCKYLEPVRNSTEFVTQYPPSLGVPQGEKFGSYYSFKGTKVLNTVENALTNKMKLEYEVFVRVVDTTSESEQTH